MRMLAAISGLAMEMLHGSDGSDKLGWSDGCTGRTCKIYTAALLPMPPVNLSAIDAASSGAGSSRSPGLAPPNLPWPLRSALFPSSWTCPTPRFPRRYSAHRSLQPGPFDRAFGIQLG